MQLTPDEGYRHLLNPEEEAVIDDTSDETKITILLESRHDIITAERDLREISTLKERGVEGAGNLEGTYDQSVVGLKADGRSLTSQRRSKEYDFTFRGTWGGYTGRQERGRWAVETVFGIRTSIPSFGSTFLSANLRSS